MADPVRVVLGSTYMPTMWDLAKAVRVARKSGAPVVFIRLTAPINSEQVEVAILSDSLYLLGIRPRDGIWREFAPDTAQSNPAAGGPAKPLLSGSRWISVGQRMALPSYRALQLPWLLTAASGATGAVTYAGSTIDLIRFFRDWDGDLGRHDARIAMLALLFILCESLRFRRIETICAAYISPIGGMPADPVARPVLTITREMLAHVQEWYKLSAAADPEILTPPAGLPDPLFS